MDIEKSILLTEKSFNFDFLNSISMSKNGNEKVQTCIQCGSCTGSCVAVEGMGVSPRQFWRRIQMGMEPEAMESMDFWNCTTCGLCDKRCPRGIPMSQLMLSLREKYAQGGGEIKGVTQTLENLKKSGNITGDDPKNRLLWLDNLVLSDNDRQKLFRKRSETVYFAGCVGSLFPQVGGIPQSLTKLLMGIGADFSLIEDELCCGYPVMGGGRDTGDLAEYAERNISAVESRGAKTLLLSCPTCYYMYKKVYPGIYGKPFSFEVMHYSEYLEKELPDKFGDTSNETVVTYHDPCDLGRKLGITDPPRNLLQRLPGVTVNEMRFSGVEGKCCGGGGNLEMANPGLSADIAAKRVEDALSTGAEYLLSSCQQCKRTLQNAARKSRARIKVLDMLEFILMRMEAAEKGVAK